LDLFMDRIHHQLDSPAGTTAALLACFIIGRRP
jgi:hypothetical protein